MTLIPVQELERAIESLSAEARARLERWFYTHPFAEDEEPVRVAESAPAYGSGWAPLSPEEYLRLEAQSAIKHEYVAGEIFAMSGSSRRHNAIALNLASELRRHLRGGPCRTYIADIKARIRTETAEFFYYPDVMVTCGQQDSGSHVVDDPRLMVEVSSPSTERTDRSEKAPNYRRLEPLEELVLVAQDCPEVTVFRRAECWVPQRIAAIDAAVEFRSIGLSLPLARIYEGVALPSAATTAEPTS